MISLREQCGLEGGKGAKRVITGFGLHIWKDECHWKSGEINIFSIKIVAIIIAIIVIIIIIIMTVCARITIYPYIEILLIVVVSITSMTELLADRNLCTYFGRF